MNRVARAVGVLLLLAGGAVMYTDLRQALEGGDPGRDFFTARGFAAYFLLSAGLIVTLFAFGPASAKARVRRALALHIEEEIARLAGLRDAGQMTGEEYEAARQRLLSLLPP